MKKVISVFLLFTFFSLNAWSQEYTSAGNKINYIQYDTVNGNMYLTPVSGAWGPLGCPNAVYAWVVGTESVRKTLLAVALSAKASNNDVLLYGSCIGGSGSQHFSVNNVLIN